jgi:polyhydroxyalkanoate synthase
LPAWRNGWLPWKTPESRPDLAASQESLRAAVASTAPDAFAAALQRQIRARHLRFLDGIAAYRRHPYARDLDDPPALWSEGTTRLRDYGAVPEAADPNGPPILVVPSLINRGYVLDLKAELSLLRHLAAQGWRPLLVDWDRPGEVERGFTLTDYVAGRLERALEIACDLQDGPVPVIGYCMGGLLALALAQRRRRDVARLALLATPWDFHAGSDAADTGAHARLTAQGAQALEPALQTLGELPVDAIQMLFAGLDPQTAVRKFTAFARLDPQSRRAERFVALEDWLNDGVPLAEGVARECLYGWYGANAPLRGHWRIAGRAVDPAEVDRPALCVLPERDRIVAPESAAALGRRLPNAELRRPALGHIGMIVSARAPEQVWRPLADWLAGRG